MVVRSLLRLPGRIPGGRPLQAGATCNCLIFNDFAEGRNKVRTTMGGGAAWVESSPGAALLHPHGSRV
jgi:hypothetical protein